MVAPIDDVLRAVFDYTCDLVQNAVEIASDALDRTVDPDGISEVAGRNSELAGGLRRGARGDHV